MNADFMEIWDFHYLHKATLLVVLFANLGDSEAASV